MSLYLIFNKMTIWVLRDNKIGSSKQAESLAKAIDNNYEVKNIIYNKFIILPNFLKLNKIGINFKKSSNIINNNPPDIIIFAGRRLAGLALYLKKYHKKHNNKNVKLISILNPNLSFKKFDIVLLPYHDNFLRRNKYKNVINFTGALCDYNPEISKEIKEYWESKLELCNKPIFLFVVGGDVKNRKMNPDKIGQLTKKISDIVSDYNGTLLITTSRRTNNECIKEIKNNLKCKNILYIYGEMNIPNPYYIFLDKSEVVFVTCDSISMVSEIATFGKSLYLYLPIEVIGKKHIEFYKNMLQRNIAKKFDFNIKKIDLKNVKILNETDEIIKQIRKIIDL